MTQVTLQQMLQAREDRVRLQQQFLETYGCPLISFTMNIAGPTKTSPLIEKGFQVGLASLSQVLPREKIRSQQIEYHITGCQAFLAVDMPADRLKELCIAIEDADPLGRLFDMDVLDLDGRKLERIVERNCIVCGKPGRGCAARRLHSVAELQAVTEGILRTHFARSHQQFIAEAAVQSLLDEVSVTPKPGLVDRNNCGSHTDMNLATFTASAHALRPYFAECVKIGQNTAAKSPAETFLQLRQAGLAAEQAMYEATGGVNTHKGVIFTMGILCGSLGRLWSPEKPIPPTAELLSQCAAIGGAAEEDYAAMTGATAGEKLYLQRGIRGIRGEVSAGLPSVASLALPVYAEGLGRGLSSNDAAACTLLHLIAHTEDTNLYHRGGEDGAFYAKQAALALLKREAWPTPAQIAELDASFIHCNLSPGGCADLLAATLFLHKLNP